MQSLLAARVQMGDSLIFHIIFSVLSKGGYSGYAVLLITALLCLVQHLDIPEKIV
jgi:hypothetical protein